MNGGPSHLHTFDIKEGGEFQSIATSVPGIRISEHFPKLAQHAQHLALLRGMATGVSIHERARYLLHTGYRSGVSPFPTAGSVVAAELGRPEFELPNFVVVDGGNMRTYHLAKSRPSELVTLQGSLKPGYLGPAHAPLLVNDPELGVENLKPLLAPKPFEERVALLEAAEKEFQDRYPLSAPQQHRASYEQALRMLRAEKAKAFDLHKEPDGVRDTYGRNRFGQACLLARRLVEVGVPFVEVVSNGWDNHGGAARPIKEASPFIDAGMAALLADLKQRGLLEHTLVIWMGEFGRTPSNGDGHYGRAWSTVLAGGGLRTGQVVGRTDARGANVEERPITAPDFLATVFHALGIDYNKRFDSNGRPVRLVDRGGKPVSELFG
jgi:hypothetical protein